MRPNSIRARMTAGFAVFIGVLMLAVCAAFFIYTKHADRQNADERLALALDEIKSELGSGEHNLDKPDELLREEYDDLRGADVALMVVDTHDKVLATSQKEVPTWPMHNDDWRVTTYTVNNRTIVIGVPWAKTERELRERTLVLLGLSVVVVLLSSVAAWFLVGRTLAPIDNLARQAQAASAESLQVRLGAPSPDTEITRLVDTLNDLLARLERTAAARGRFYAAASHELRTPLQALTGHLEVALSRRRTAHDYEVALDEGRAQAERLTTLVQDLLLLNQLDANTSRPPGVLLDLADICENELAHLRPEAATRGLIIELTLPERCELTAPWHHIEMLVRNLLENAVKYATLGGEVHITLKPGRLKVYNDCAPIEGWDADKYFEPFFRPDASRNSQTGGNGLGLAICKAICDSDGWDIDLRPEKDGMSATVTFSDAGK